MYARFLIGNREFCILTVDAVDAMGRPARIGEVTRAGTSTLLLLYGDGGAFAKLSRRRSSIPSDVSSATWLVPAKRLQCM